MNREERQLNDMLNRPIRADSYVTPLKVDHGRPDVTYRRFLRGIYNEFGGDGFRAREVNTFLREEYALRVSSAFFQILVRKGLLTKQKGVDDYKENTYFFVQDTDQYLLEETEKSSGIPLKGDERDLLETFLRVKGGLEGIVSQDPEFRNFMEALKRVDAETYRISGGEYYESLVEEPERSVSETEEVSRLSIDEVFQGTNLNTRARHGLQSEGIETMRELAELSEEDLYSIENLGDKTINRIKEKLDKHGLELER